MAQISKTELKRAILAVEAERLKHPVVSRPDRARYPKLLNSRRAAAELASDFLRQAGLDTKKIEALQERQSAELQRIVDKHKADALTRASRQNDTLRSTMEQSRALRDLAAQGDFFPNPSFNLDTPFLIWTIPLMALSDSAAVPFGSWAKFKAASSESQDLQKVGFYFYWPNPYDDYAVIDATTFMSATGYVTADAPSSFFGANASLVVIEARFGLWLGWPPQQAASASYAREQLGIAGALSTPLWGSNDAISISAGVNLNKTMFSVPPRNVVVFEVALALVYQNHGDGTTEADFESGDFQIACPVVVFSLLNSPSGSMMA